MWQDAAHVRDDGRAEIQLRGMRAGNQLAAGAFKTRARPGPAAGQNTEGKIKTNGQPTEEKTDPTSGPAGESLPLITGQESLDELRRKIIEFAQAGAARQPHLQGPFRILGSLSHDSLSTIVNSLPREACEDLFKMEQSCRHPLGTPDAGKSQAET